MKLRELLVETKFDTINKVNQEEFLIIVEGIGEELKDLTSDSITKPYTRFKSKQTSDFSNKLRSWAERSLSDIKPGKQKEKYEKILGKIIDNPRAAAQQIFSSVMSKKVEDDMPKRKPEGFDFWLTTFR